MSSTQKFLDSILERALIFEPKRAPKPKNSTHLKYKLMTEVLTAVEATDDLHTLSKVDLLLLDVTEQVKDKFTPAEKALLAKQNITFTLSDALRFERYPVLKTLFYTEDPSSEHPSFFTSRSSQICLQGSELRGVRVMTFLKNLIVTLQKRDNPTARENIRNIEGIITTLEVTKIHNLEELCHLRGDGCSLNLVQVLRQTCRWEYHLKDFCRMTGLQIDGEIIREALSESINQKSP